MSGRYRCRVLALLLVAVSLGLSNFAAAIGIGAAGIDGRTRLRVGLVFGVFEAGMPAVGLLLGRGLAHALGPAARAAGGAALIAAGAYGVVQAVRAGRAGRAGQASHAGGRRVTGGAQPTWQILAAGLALSVDNLAVGFALGTYHVGLAVAAVTIGAVSVAMSLGGLELGARIGTAAGHRGELLGGLVLVAVGVAVAAGVI